MSRNISSPCTNQEQTIDKRQVHKRDVHYHLSDVFALRLLLDRDHILQPVTANHGRSMPREKGRDGGGDGVAFEA